MKFFRHFMNGDVCRLPGGRGRSMYSNTTGRLWCLLIGILVLFSIGMAESRAGQLALVVGIDNYLHGSDRVEPGKVLNLRGAENDAKVIAAALREQNVYLPDDRVLLGSDATRENFLDRWNSLQSEAKAGDTVYVTFAGHGGQEMEFAQPLDEQQGDGHDETLMFYEFDPNNAQTGRLTDDELYTLFKDVGSQRLILVADTCHSGGLTRAVGQSSERSRNGGRWQVNVSLDDVPETIASEGENWDSLPHVTYITATADESKTVDEITYGDKRHGALSLSFAEGVRGAADRDKNGLVLRRELEDYVSYQVATYSNRLQTPGFAPRGAAASNTTVFAIDSDSDEDAVQNLSRCEPQMVDEPVAIQVTGGVVPEGLTGYEIQPLAALQFQIGDQQTRVLHEVDEVTRILHSGEVSRRWQSVIDKYRLLRSIDHCFDQRSEPLSISLACARTDGNCDVARRISEKEQVTFRFGDAGSEFDDAYLVLFNLAGSGELQWLYPYPDDPQPLDTLPFELNDITIGAPAGRDDMVAALCANNPEPIIELLASHDGSPAPPSAEFVRLAAAERCQWGRYATFSIE
jgi:hypothetical protein